MITFNPIRFILIQKQLLPQPCCLKILFDGDLIPNSYNQNTWFIFGMKRNIIETKRYEYYKKNRKEIGGFLSHLELLLNLVQLFFFIWILTLISKRNMIEKLKKLKYETHNI